MFSVVLQVNNNLFLQDRTMWSTHRVKNPTGIPESFLTNIDNLAVIGQPGVMRTMSGRAVVPTMDA
jgi:hypothetical protein